MAEICERLLRPALSEGDLTVDDVLTLLAKSGLDEYRNNLPQTASLQLVSPDHLRRGKIQPHFFGGHSRTLAQASVFLLSSPYGAGGSLAEFSRGWLAGSRDQTSERRWFRSQGVVVRAASENRCDPAT